MVKATFVLIEEDCFTIKVSTSSLRYGLHIIHRSFSERENGKESALNLSCRYGIFIPQFVIQNKLFKMILIKLIYLYFTVDE